MITMTDFNEEMGKVLGIYRCNEFIELLEDIYELILLYNVDEHNDWVSDIVGRDDTRDVRLARTAYLLSKFAYRHADRLKRVKRAAPALWQKLEQLDE